MPDPGGSEPRLPHRAPALLVVRVLARGQAHLEALARVPAASPFRVQRESVARAPAVLALEMAAQTAAAFESDAPAGDSMQHGLLVALRDVRLHAHEIDADADFHVSVDLAGRAHALREWSFAVRCDGALVAEGTISTYGS